MRVRKLVVDASKVKRREGGYRWGKIKGPAFSYAKIFHYYFRKKYERYCTV